MAYTDIQGYGQGGGHQQVPMMEYNQPTAYGMMNGMQEPNSLTAGIYSLMMSSQEDDLQQVLTNIKPFRLKGKVSELATFNPSCS